MIRVTVSYPATESQRFDHNYYQSTHAALIRKLLTPHGLQRVEIDQCLNDGAGKPPPIVAAAHMLFTDLAAFKAGMAVAGKTLAADMKNYTDTAPTVVICDTR
ncbi:hypothetical protein ASE39_24485 [Acidovorax sp. Root267]|uniref:EthD family reductase n=1 Tax=Acidovorax sp. Root267 TaxID=1736505 RepID=UPI00070D1F1E|nr:EthD family reductase [Acidovorax sp. Root267]KRD23584.1 hypothetical protein ASE39_24485 [Acidovorax sp. Root267]